MKLSKDTLELLKNFASINDGIVFRAGKTLRTCDASKQVLAETTISEEIPAEFGIFDLNRFLSALSLHRGDSEMTIDSATKSAVLTGNSGRSTITYRLCDTTMVKNAPEKSIVMPTNDVQFTLEEDDLADILKASAVLGTPHIAIKSDGSKVFLAAIDNKNTSTHTNQIEIGTGNGKKYTMLFKTENLKMIPGKYDVIISFKGLATFKNTTKPLQYWVATEVGSSGEA